jgi:hypothetical protein
VPAEFEFFVQDDDDNEPCQRQFRLQLSKATSSGFHKVMSGKRDLKKQRRGKNFTAPELNRNLRLLMRW